MPAERYACVIDVRSFCFFQNNEADRSQLVINPHLKDFFDSLSSQLVQSRIQGMEIELFIFGRQDEFDLARECYLVQDSVPFSDIEYSFFMFKNEYRLSLMEVASHSEVNVSQEIRDSLWQIVDEICESHATPKKKKETHFLFSEQIHFIVLPEHLTHLAKELNVSVFNKILLISADCEVLAAAQEVGCLVCPTYLAGTLHQEDVKHFYEASEKTTYSKLMLCFGGQSLFFPGDQTQWPYNPSMMELIAKLQRSSCAYAISYSVQNIFDNDHKTDEQANLDSINTMDQFFQMITFMMYHDCPFKLPYVRLPEIWQGVLRSCHLSVLLEVGRVIVYLEPDLNKAKALANFVATKIPNDLQHGFCIVRVHEKGEFPVYIIDLVPKWLNLDVPSACESEPMQAVADDDFDDCDTELASSKQASRSVLSAVTTGSASFFAQASGAMARFTPSLRKLPFT